MDELKIDKLIEAESRKTDFSLSPGFADRLARKVEKRMVLKENIGIFMTMSLSFVGLCIATIALMLLLDWRYGSNWVDIIVGRKQIIFYLMVFFAFSYFIDRVILPLLYSLRRK